MSLKIVIAGSTGRMGRALIESIAAEDGLKLHAALERPGVPGIGQDAGEFAGVRSGVLIATDVEAAVRGADVLIDFTRPEATLHHAEACARNGVRMVVGTTGFSAEQKQRLAELAKANAMVMAPNMSVGVNVLLRLIEVAAKTLGDGYDVEIIEAHHRHKVDAPSGTALRMGEVIAAALGRDLKDCAVYERHGHTGERDPSSIGFATIRGGDIVGDHTVLFAGTGERIEISHKSSNRAGYAQGSLRAARFLAGRASGLYDMADVLGL